MHWVVEVHGEVGLADEYVVASSQSIECRELQYWEYVVELLFRRYEEECLSLCVPNRNIESDEVSCEAAPWACAVYDYVVINCLAFRCLEGLSNAALCVDLYYLNSALDASSVSFHLLSECVGDHCSVEVSVILCIASTEDGVYIQ